MAKPGDNEMDQKDVAEVATLRRQIEELNDKLERRDEQINALKGYLQQRHVEPEFLPA